MLFMLDEGGTALSHCRPRRKPSRSPFEFLSPAQDIEGHTVQGAVTGLSGGGARRFLLAAFDASHHTPVGQSRARAGRATEGRRKPHSSRGRFLGPGARLTRRGAACRRAITRGKRPESGFRGSGLRQRTGMRGRRVARCCGSRGPRRARGPIARARGGRRRNRPSRRRRGREPRPAVPVSAALSRGRFLVPRARLTAARRGRATPDLVRPPNRHRTHHGAASSRGSRPPPALAVAATVTGYWPGNWSDNICRSPL